MNKRRFALFRCGLATSAATRLTIGAYMASPPGFASAILAQIFPPCDSTIERRIDSPIPMPSARVVKNG